MTRGVIRGVTKSADNGQTGEAITPRTAKAERRTDEEHELATTRPWSELYSEPTLLIRLFISDQPHSRRGTSRGNIVLPGGRRMRNRATGVCLTALFCAAPALATSDAFAQDRTYVVKKGDTCASIAAQVYGDSRLVEPIHVANNMTAPPPHAMKKHDASQPLRRANRRVRSAVGCRLRH